MAKKNSTARSSGHGHDKPERSESDRSKSSRPVASVGSIANWEAEESVETYSATGDFERDFSELCQRNEISSVKVSPRPHRPSSPTTSPLDSSMSKGGKESKEDRNRNHVNHQPPDQNEDKTTEPPALTYVTKNQFEYFQPRVEIETEDEGNKTYLKEIYIKGWKIDQKLMEVLLMTLPKQERLASVNFWNTGLTDETLESLANILQQCQALKDLCLDGNTYIRRHRYDLFLTEESSLQNLSLKNCYVNDIGAENIGEALVNNKNLQTLNLCFNKITCAGAESLANGLRLNRTLLSLNLGSNLIGNKGCMKISESLSKFALTHKEVVQRRIFLSKKPSEEPISPSRGGGVGTAFSGQRPPSVKSGSHLKDEKKNRDAKGTSKKKDAPLKTLKDGINKKPSSIDLPAKVSNRKDKKSPSARMEKKGPAQPDHDTPEFFEFPHPLLETSEEIDGQRWISGNRALINLNLARNKIGLDGVQAFINAIQYQNANPLTKAAGMGLFRLSLQGNSFNRFDSIYVQLCETMVTRDPFYKPPPTPGSYSEVKEEN